MKFDVTPQLRIAHPVKLGQRSGETPDFSNTLFLLDESSMVGNTDMARAYALIAAGGGRAVAGLVMTVLTVGLVSCAGKSLPRFWPGDFFPVFYACHLAVLGVLAL